LISDGRSALLPTESPLFSKDTRMTYHTGVHPALAQALEKRGYETLTPVQSDVLAPELGSSDLLVSAQTGSGKTVAFGLAIAPDLLGTAEKFAYAPAPVALAIAPTRELALQVKRELEWLYADTGAVIASCVGGMDYRTEKRTLDKGAQIVVGTPGRLRDHIERGSLDLSMLRAVVLDEADEMLDLGFRDELEFILGKSPSDRRTLMFSATVPRSIASLAERYQRDAVRVKTDSDKSQHVDIEYRALNVAPRDEENAIINVLRYYDAQNAIVFCNTRAAVNHLTTRLGNRGFSVVALSGELSQNERTHALQSMRDGRARVCVATDVAARGIDLPNLELVIHAELPKNREGLLHRSGRTGRAGNKGVSALIVPTRARRRTERLLQTAQVNATWDVPPSAEAVLRRDDERILEDSTIAAPLSAPEADFARTLLDRFGAEQIAGALVRAYRKNHSAPEELRAPGEADSAPRGRNDFDDGVWFSLSIGHKQNAEPRWMLPMLAKNGALKKGEIGSIRIQQMVSYVEISPKAVARFLKAIGPEMKLEKTITISQIDGIPEVVKSAPEERKPSFRNKSTKPHRGKSDQKPDWKPEGKSGGKPSGKPGGKPDDKPAKKKRPKKKDRKA